MLTLSLIIPVYNEERHIKACLDAIAGQTVLPAEVIVVNNNCTDNTVAIAKKYPFVTIVNETTQGLIAARNAGFNAASSDILGRIDADVQIDSDWVEQAINQFENNNSLYGISGPSRTSLSPLLPSNTYQSTVYFWFVNAIFRTPIMWGSNMAITAVAWDKIKHVATDDGYSYHEDQDVSVCIAANSMTIMQSSKIVITTDGAAFTSIRKTIHYLKMMINTLQLHKNNGNIPGQIEKLPLLKVIPKFLVSLIGLAFMLINSAVLSLIAKLKR